MYQPINQSSYWNLVKIYEHALGAHFTSYNMVVGPFGGIHGSDIIGVQSMDGRIQVGRLVGSSQVTQ